MKTKICSKQDCHLACIEQNIENFSFRKDTSKYKNYCKECCKKQNKHYVLHNKKKYLKQQKEYRDDNKEHISLQKKEYGKSNKEKIAARNAIYKQKNAKKISIRKSEYYQENKERILITHNLYTKNKRKNDPVFKLRKTISQSIRAALIISLSSKNKNSCIKYLNYSIQELKEYLEGLFEPWMNWNNRGNYNPQTWNDNDLLTWTWQLDHIIPQSKLPYAGMEDENFNKCWALSNLRPYSAKQNLLDGNRR